MDGWMDGWEKNVRDKPNRWVNIHTHRDTEIDA